MSDQADMQKLINEYLRRLQKLKEQEAKFGASTPPHILTEIEDIEEKLKNLGYSHNISYINKSVRKNNIRWTWLIVGVFPLFCLFSVCQFWNMLTSTIGTSVPPTSAVAESDPALQELPLDQSNTPTLVSPTPTIDTTVLFFDDFNDGIKQDWVEDYGEWRMVNGNLVSVNYVDETARIFVGNPDWTDYTINIETGSFTSNFIKGNAVAILARVQDSSNYVWFLVNYSGVICGIKRDGIDTTFSSFRDSGIYEGDHRALVSAEGNKYTFLINDEQICEFEDNTFLKGNVGLWATPDMRERNPWIDNFKVTQIP